MRRAACALRGGLELSVSESRRADLVRSAFLEGLALAFVWTAPVLLQARVTSLLTWLLGFGLSGLVFVPLLALHRALVPWGGFERAMLIGLMLASTPLMLFARLLIENTHHRPLGSVTFAVIGFGMASGAIALASRSETLATRGKRLPWVLCRVLGLLSFVGMTFQLLVASAPCRPLSLATLWGFALLTSLVIRGDRLLPSQVTARVPVWLAAFVWVVISAIGIGIFMTSPVQAGAVFTPLAACGLLRY
jgi:hypothetical protein